MKYKVLRQHLGDRMYMPNEERDASERDVAHLVRAGVLRRADEEPSLREDGPTVAEYVDAGYLASNYPPEGYASRSTAEEIAEAISAQEQAAEAELQQKAEDAPANKAEKAPKNKAEKASESDAAPEDAKAGDASSDAAASDQA